MSELDNENNKVSDSEAESENTSKAKKGSKNAKRTLNLCQKERSTISGAAFVLTLAIILAVLVAVEYFGAYRPYKNLEALQAEIDRQQTEIDDLNAGMSDMDKVRDDYNRYNYVGFDTSIVDRNKIFELLDTVIFEKYPNAQVGTLSLSGNVLRFTLVGLDLEEINGLVADFFKSDMVSGCTHSYTSTNNAGEPTADMRIVFVIPEGGNE